MGGRFAFLPQSPAPTAAPQHIWAQPDLGGFIPQWGLPSGGHCSAWETQGLALTAQGKHPKNCRDTWCPQRRAQEHTYTAWEDTYGPWAGWIPGKKCRQHCCTFGAGAGEPLGKGERLSGASSLSGHLSRYPLNMAPGLVIQSTAPLQQFAVKTLQNQECNQGFMIWGAQIWFCCPHHLHAQQLPISRASCDIWCKLTAHQLACGNLCLCLAPTLTTTTYHEVVMVSPCIKYEVA